MKVSSISIKVILVILLIYIKMNDKLIQRIELKINGMRHTRTFTLFCLSVTSMCLFTLIGIYCNILFSVQLSFTLPNHFEI